MATFLATPKMNPALAARVEAAVRGRRVVGGAVAVDRSPWLNAASRLAVASVVLLLIGAMSVAWMRQRDARESMRTALLADVDRQAKALSARERALPVRLGALLTDALKDQPDVVRQDALAQLEARPLIYLRADRDAASDPATLLKAARESAKDTFLLCLFEPPADDTEKTLLTKVHLAYAGGVAARTKNVFRMNSVMAAIPLLSAPWRQRVEQASSLPELAQLRSLFDRAPIVRGIEATKAELLLYVIDDPPDAGAPIELDGASRHDVRVGVIDITTGEPLLRMKTKLDPAWISDDSRVELGRSLNACRLAMDARRRVTE